MHIIEPFYRWDSLYCTDEDSLSPLCGEGSSLESYEHTIYGYYIHPAWYYIGSETLYLKVLYVDYKAGYAVFELIGEWNDTLHNDIMHLKRNVVDQMVNNGINKYILIGENIFNFHGMDDEYYLEWFDEVEEGWVACLGFADFVQSEMSRFGLDMYMHMGGGLDEILWRTLEPHQLLSQVDKLIMRRLGA